MHSEQLYPYLTAIRNEVTLKYIKIEGQGCSEDGRYTLELHRLGLMGPIDSNINHSEELDRFSNIRVLILNYLRE
jgi:hypothetical protein